MKTDNELLDITFEIVAKDDPRYIDIFGLGVLQNFIFVSVLSVRLKLDIDFLFYLRSVNIGIKGPAFNAQVSGEADSKMISSVLKYFAEKVCLNL